MKLSIRKVRPSDISSISHMMLDMRESAELDYPTVDSNEIEKAMFYILSQVNNPACIFLIAFDGKQPAGFFLGSVSKRPYGKPEVIGVAQELYVVPNKRGQGVGEKLIREAIKTALSLGAQGFEAVAVTGKTDKRWLTFGFKPYVLWLYLPLEEAKATFLRPSDRMNNRDSLKEG